MQQEKQQIKAPSGAFFLRHIFYAGTFNQRRAFRRRLARTF